MQTIEAIVILIALASLWPLIVGYQWAATEWYKFGYLSVILVVMIWVTRRRMARIRAAAGEAKRKRDAAEKSGRPPWLGG